MIPNFLKQRSEVESFPYIFFGKILNFLILKLTQNVIAIESIRNLDAGFLKNLIIVKMWARVEVF